MLKYLNPSRLFAAALAVILLSSGVAVADPGGPSSSEAEEFFQRGRIAAEQQEWNIAIRNFERAHRLAPFDPAILHGLGLAEAQVPGRELRAIVWFKAYLAAVPDDPDAASIRHLINQLDVKVEAKIDRIISTLKEPSSPSGVQIAALAIAQASSGDFRASRATAERLAEGKGTILRWIAAIESNLSDTRTSNVSEAEWVEYADTTLAKPVFLDFPVYLGAISSRSTANDVAIGMAWTVTELSHVRQMIRAVNLHLPVPQIDEGLTQNSNSFASTAEVAESNRLAQVEQVRAARAAEERRAANAAEALEKFLDSLDGGVWLIRDDSIWRIEIEIHGRSLYYRSTCKGPDAEPRYNSYSLIANLTEREFVVPHSHFRDLNNTAAGFIDAIGTISHDGNIIQYPRCGGRGPNYSQTFNDFVTARRIQ